MPLTPEDVSNKRFTPVRLREGYDMGEVDQFLDEVEAELARLAKESDDLRAKLSSAQGAGPGSTQATSAGTAQAAPESEASAEATPEPAVAAPAAAVETIRVTTVPEASSAAARLLELATRSADQLVDEAKNDAERIVGEARTEVERLEAESKTKTDLAESEARTRAEMLDTETAERRTQLFGDLEKERNKLNAEVENLRSFEREYRSRLKSYFTQQLAALDGAGEAPTPDEQQVAPQRLRTILGEDDSSQG